MFQGLLGIFFQRREHGGHKDGNSYREECPMGVNHYTLNDSLTDDYRDSLRRANRIGRSTNEHCILSRHSSPVVGGNWIGLESSLARARITG